MAVDVMLQTEGKERHMHLIHHNDDVIEQELRLRQPKHKRLEYVAGWNIHQLVKDARKSRPKLHTRDGFHLKSSFSDVSSLFEHGSTYSSMRGSTSTKSSKRSSITAVTSTTLSTKFRFYDMLRFHPVHGSNVVLSCDRQVASRKPDSFCNGLVFGHRPVKFGEAIHLRFNKVRPDWRGCIRLGFTPYNPARCNSASLPSYAVPDLSRRSRFWAIPIPEKYATKYNIFSFVCKDDGSVSFMINNEGKGIFATGLSTKISLWPMLDLYGKVEELAIVDDETAERGSELLLDSDCDDSDSETDGHFGRKTKRSSLSKSSENVVAFHDTCGRNVRMDSRRTVAKRFDSFWNALTFIAKPLRTSDMTFIEIAKVEANYAGALGVGLTNVNPATLKSEDLPDNADLLVVSPGKYWRISRDIETEQGDQLGFILEPDGRMVYSKNGSKHKVLFDKISTKEHNWLICDLYGSTTTVKLMGRIKSFDPKQEVTEKYNFSIDHVQDEETELECLMCFKKDRRRDCTIQPCGHIALCHWCAITCMVKQQLRFIVCPVCGGPVKDAIRILRRKSFAEPVES
uniref:Neuralized-b protein n=1 Tax=Ciona intestinalis TaxID=7719 RepID=Q4H355_CIOIN|nr:Neuralized-b protein [Ciona intestinalis]XP_026691144.1 neuralized-b protein isoform X1 [Ciona intestinalis]BAE06572.1 Ci-Neuralized-b [Ciona intestinalis]|eukprot:NP_001071769.1 Neuralized-b protein [Ciona intestinalis]